MTYFCFTPLRDKKDWEIAQKRGKGSQNGGKIVKQEARAQIIHFFFKLGIGNKKKGKEDKKTKEGEGV